MALQGVFCFLVTAMIFSSFCATAQDIVTKGRPSENVVTIQTTHGDVYDCVDFYKQPAFDHPLLQTHNFHPQMRPTSRPKIQINKNYNNSTHEIKIDTNTLRLKDGGCPKGTVPIRRVNKTDDGLQKHNPIIDGTIFGLAQTKSSPWTKYNGVGAAISVYNPKVISGQYSSGEIVLRGGSDTIIVGWTVNPNKYQDNVSRMFIYTIAGDLHCFNSECGFITVRSDFPLDVPLHPVSVRGVKSYTYEFFVYQDSKNGNWWLEVGNDATIIGFWPQRIFEGMKNSATYIACGGEINTMASMPPPEMGAGHYPDFVCDELNAAFCKDFIMVNEANVVVDAKGTEKYVNNDYYGAYDHDQSDGQHIVNFGGRGF